MKSLARHNGSAGTLILDAQPVRLWKVSVCGLEASHSLLFCYGSPTRLNHYCKNHLRMTTQEFSGNIWAACFSPKKLCTTMTLGEFPPKKTLAKGPTDKTAPVAGKSVSPDNYGYRLKSFWFLSHITCSFHPCLPQEVPQMDCFFPWWSEFKFSKTLWHFVQWFLWETISSGMTEPANLTWKAVWRVEHSLHMWPFSVNQIDYSYLLRLSAPNSIWWHRSDVFLSYMVSHVS